MAKPELHVHIHDHGDPRLDLIQLELHAIRVGVDGILHHLRNDAETQAKVDALTDRVKAISARVRGISDVATDEGETNGN